MIKLQDWGLIDYEIAWARQKALVAEVQADPESNILVLCQHPTVITVGRGGKDSNILLSEKLLKAKRIKVVYNDRGGDVTLHNPGQLVGYPIFNLNNFKTDLHWFLREIEEAIISLIGIFGIKGERIPGLTGVWVGGNRKICAIGLHCSRWVTSHGFALNVSNNLDEFNYIVPCGITDKGVTSISKEIGTQIDINLVKQKCFEVFEKRFS
ncbi:MAG: lipoyl(octanoyl) transferase LipB [Candidatus Kapaibacteriales bacterium]